MTSNHNPMLHWEGAPRMHLVREDMPLLAALAQLVERSFRKA